MQLVNTSLLEIQLFFFNELKKISLIKIITFYLHFTCKISTGFVLITVRKNCWYLTNNYLAELRSQRTKSFGSYKILKLIIPKGTSHSIYSISSCFLEIWLLFVRIVFFLTVRQGVSSTRCFVYNSMSEDIGYD